MFKIDDAIKQAETLFPNRSMTSAVAQIDVESSLVNLLYANQWAEPELMFFHGWMKKMDVAKTHYMSYDNDWKISPARKQISKNHYRLSILLAMKFLSHEKVANGMSGQILKTTNVLFKMLDFVESVFSLNSKDIKVHLMEGLQVFQSQIVESTRITPVTSLELTTLPITVLFSEGPIARAYLETIHALGLRVNKIIKLVSSIDLVSKKPVGGILPGTMKVNYASSKQYKQMFYWPNFYLAKSSAAVNMIMKQVQDKLSFAADNLNQATQNRDLVNYSDHVESLFVKGLNDPQLTDKLAVEGDQLFLYTGGGIVPESLLNIADKRLIHIHPGYLPEIKGADCVLWSQIMMQRMSASAFFMAPGIDVGDVLQACWLPSVVLNFPKDADSRVKYRLIYSFLDPWVRSFVLRQLIINTQGLTTLMAKPQNKDDGITYHFMHDQLKQLAFNRFQHEQKSTT